MDVEIAAPVAKDLQNRRDSERSRSTIKSQDGLHGVPFYDYQPGNLRFGRNEIQVLKNKF